MLSPDWNNMRWITPHRGKDKGCIQYINYKGWKYASIRYNGYTFKVQIFVPTFSQVTAFDNADDAKSYVEAMFQLEDKAVPKRYTEEAAQ